MIQRCEEEGLEGKQRGIKQRVRVREGERERPTDRKSGRERTGGAGCDIKQLI